MHYYTTYLRYGLKTIHSVTSFKLSIEFFLVCSCCSISHHKHSQNKRLEFTHKVCFENNNQWHNSDISFNFFIICQAKIGQIFFNILNKSNFINLSQYLQLFSINRKIHGTLWNVWKKNHAEFRQNWISGAQCTDPGAHC